MFGVIDLTIKISPNWKIQYIEVWGARRPEVFGPEIIVVAGPVLDEVGHVTGHPVLHQDGLRIVYKVGLDPKDVVGLQHPLQVALSPKLRLISRSPEADWQGVRRQPVQNHNLGRMYGGQGQPDVIWGTLGLGLDDEPGGPAAADENHGQVPVISEQVEGHFFIKIEWIHLDSSSLDSLKRLVRLNFFIPGHWPGPSLVLDDVPDGPVWYAHVLVHALHGAAGADGHPAPDGVDQPGVVNFYQFWIWVIRLSFNQHLTTILYVNCLSGHV